MHSIAQHSTKRKPLALALLAILPVFAQPILNPAPTTSSSPSAAPGNPTLPDLGSSAANSASIRPGPNGVTIENSFDGKKIIVTPEYSDQTGWSISATLASMLGDNAAIGVLLNTGANKSEILLNAGFKPGAGQQFILTVGQLEQFLDYAFRSGTEKVGITQTSAALNYQWQLGQEFLRYLELKGYVAQTASRDLVGKTFTVDTATLYELWNEPRRIAGGTVSGLQARMSFVPLQGSTVRVSLGQERIRYDWQAGASSTDHTTAGLEWSQQLGRGYQLRLAADTLGSQDVYTLALERSLFGSAGQQTLGISWHSVRGRDGLGDDNQLKLSYTYHFGAGSRASQSGIAEHAASTATRPGSLSSPADPRRSSGAGAAGMGLLQQVATRPTVIPGHVLARVDTLAPTRLIAVNKAALPVGASVNAAGVITTPVGVAVVSIAGITLNGLAFVNNGQFALNGNNLVVVPSLITQPAVGVTDTYAVTLNNTGGGTSVATVVVSRGSIKIDSITVTAGVVADATAPVTTAAPAVSGTTHTATTLSVTINEADTGYYLVQAAAAAAPTVAQVQAGTSFAMTANVAATPAISGLTASTAYKIYFVAKDNANNVQAAVQSVAVTTTAAPDLTAPTTTAAPSVSGTTDTATTLSVTINEAGTGYYLVQAAAAAAPTVAAVQAGTAFAMTANVAATPAISGLTASTAYKIYFVAKDSANNVQAAVQSVAATTTAAPDLTAPTTTAAPSVSGTSATSTTLSVTINQAGTGYYLVQAAAAAAPTVAAVQAGTSFAMTANVAATPAISGLSASTAYKIYFVAKDTANNVQATVQSVAATTTAAPDLTAPTTTAAPSVSGTTDTATTLSVTINEAGTGYYLVQAAGAAAPTVAAVQAGTAFALTANVAATPAISGLTASTAYKIYFVAKDAANNVQTAVQNVAVTTTAAPDLTAPTTTAAPSVSGTTDTATTLSVTINEAGTGYYLVQAAAAAAPTVAAVQAGTSFAMTANVAATPAISGLTASTAYKIYFVAKDAANNVQTAVQNVAVTTTAAPDLTAPTTTAAPSVSGTSATSTTLSVTINEAGTGYYMVKSAASAAPSVELIQLYTAFAMTANVAATPAISGLRASTAYKIYFVAKDAAGNVQAAVQNVAVTTTTASLPAGYVVQGGLTWTPNTIGSTTFGGDFNNWGVPGGYTNWTTANSFCAAGTFNGQTGWRLPTFAELEGLYSSGAINGQGWALDFTLTWSSWDFGSGFHASFDLGYGNSDSRQDTYGNYVTCVR